MAAREGLGVNRYHQKTRLTIHGGFSYIPPAKLYNALRPDKAAELEKRDAQGCDVCGSNPTHYRVGIRRFCKLHKDFAAKVMRKSQTGYASHVMFGD